METKSFDTNEITVQGRKYLQMEPKVFVDFALELSKYVKRINKAELEQYIKEYEYAKTYNRKRLRMKKEKKALKKMVILIFEDALNKLNKKEKRKFIS